MIVDRINQYLTAIKNAAETREFDFSEAAKYIFKRQFCTPEESDSGKLRLSSSGKCARQLAYAYHNFQKNGKEINSRSKIVFFTGDVAESMVVSLAQLAGCNLKHTGQNQLTVNFMGIGGHPDGILEADEHYLFECKSMTSFSFKAFERGILDSSYLAQINMYMEALGLHKCVVVALNKEAGVLGELILDKDPAIVEKTKKNLESVIASSPKNLPDRAFSPSEDGKLPWNCLYCSFWGICWPKAEKVLKGSAYILKVKKEKPDGKLERLGETKQQVLETR